MEAYQGTKKKKNTLPIKLWRGLKPFLQSSRWPRPSAAYISKSASQRKVAQQKLPEHLHNVSGTRRSVMGCAVATVSCGFEWTFWPIK